MANDTYVVDDLVVAGGPTITVTDDGSGSDWISIQGSYAEECTIRLEWDSNGSQSIAASGIFFEDGLGSGRLVVKGVIENVRGSLTADWINGNELANLIYGDQTAGGPGGNDTIDAGDGNDKVWGGQGNDSIIGALGDDTIWGGDGNDTISGSEGIDLVIGGAGADSVAGGSNNGDTVSYVGSSAAVRIVLTAGSTTTGVGGDAGGDSLFGFTDIVGSDFADVLSDSVKGEISGGGNANRFFGGLGSDRMFLGGADDAGYGGAGQDRLFGENQDDRLYGGDDGDLLVGGKGADRLWGGTGADDFDFLAANESTGAERDRIADFERGLDLIRLAAIDADTSSASDQAFSFIADGRFHGVAGELRFKATADGVLLLGDVDGDKAADFVLLVAGVTALDLADLDL